MERGEYPVDFMPVNVVVSAEFQLGLGWRWDGALYIEGEKGEGGTKPLKQD